MAHMIWKGAISFGLVHVPVKLYPATTKSGIGFDLLDKRSLDPIGYRKINKTTGREVTKEDIVRGLEYEKGQYVVLSDEEIRQANVKSTQTVDIVAFVNAPQVSFLYLDTPYFLEPDRGGDKTYALLREALKESGRIGIALVVMHGKQHLAALVPAGPVLALNTLRWAADVRSLDELKLPPANAADAGVSSRELAMAKRLIDDMSDEWKPDQYRDTFHDDVLALVQRKIAAGKTRQLDALEAPAAPRPGKAEVVDLSELLRRSLGARGGRGAANDAAEDSRDDEAQKSKPAARKRGSPRSGAPETPPRGRKSA